MTESINDERQYFLDRVSIDDAGCWNWMLTVHEQGYGMCHRNRVMGYAHRYSYEAFVGPIPDGLQIDHLCRNRRCINPDHLEVVTAQENIARRAEAQTGQPYPGYSVYRAAYDGRWAVAVNVSTKPRRRKVFSAQTRERAIAKYEQWAKNMREAG